MFRAITTTQADEISESGTYNVNLGKELSHLLDMKGISVFLKHDIHGAYIVSKTEVIHAQTYQAWPPPKGSVYVALVQPPLFFNSEENRIDRAKEIRKLFQQDVVDELPSLVAKAYLQEDTIEKRITTSEDSVFEYLLQLGIDLSDQYPIDGVYVVKQNFWEPDNKIISGVYNLSYRPKDVVLHVKADPNLSVQPRDTIISSVLRRAPTLFFSNVDQTEVIEEYQPQLITSFEIAPKLPQVLEKPPID